MLDIIKKKRDGFELSQVEIDKVVMGYTRDDIPDYQIAAFLMAVYFKGMNETETAHLTQSILDSGEKIDLSEINGIKVDKHSSGGVGDKITLILAPLVASAGVPVAKMSGRGLGHTGGTIDKIEAIAGFNIDLSADQFIDKIKKHNIAICGQNENLVPADKKIYALRDITGTVDNHSLIASSIMSKKLACGADAIVIDLKVGGGAYMKTIEQAENLANIMINTGQKMGRKVHVVLSAMDQPLGYSVGNALEVEEAIEALKGNGPDDLMELTFELGANMLKLANRVSSLEEGKDVLKELIANGKAFDKFVEFIESQGGDVEMVKNTSLLPQAKHERAVLSERSGVVTDLKALKVGLASVVLGAGRETKDSVIDMGAGIVLKKKLGDRIEKGENMATLFSNSEDGFVKAEALIRDSFVIGEGTFDHKPIIIKTII